MIACALGAATGCDRVLGLSAATTADAYSPNSPGCARDHDEDGDQINDCDDNCPGVANLAQDDVLEVLNGEVADHVGDVCDPAPTKGGDARVKFISFAGPTEYLEWTTVSGDWSVQNDAFIYTSQTVRDGTAAWLGRRPPPPFAFAARVVVDSVGFAEAAPTDAKLFVALDGDVTSRQWACSLEHQYRSGSPYMDFLVASDNVTDYSDTPLAQGAIAAGAAFDLRASLVTTGTMTTLACSVVDVTGTQYATRLTTATAPTHGIRFDSLLMAAHVDYLELYDLSNETP